jgi:hypothetical protein
VLRIEILKQADGAGVLRCTRQDGSVTWQKQTKHGAYFALHDLTHYAVETVLGYRHGFFGLIAAGWDVEDTTGKGARGALPPEAIEVEQIVGLLQTEQASSTLWTAGEFNQFAPRSLTDAEINGVRAVRATLFQKWFATGTGEKLQLEFEPGTSN